MQRPTLAILTERVGLGGANRDQGSIRRLQALLYHGQFLKAHSLSAAANGHWDEKSHNALAACLHLPPSSKDVYLEPFDPRMRELLFNSPCTFPVYPGERGATPFLKLQRYFKTPPVTPFRYPLGMLVWGVDRVPDLAIVTKDFDHGRWALPIHAVFNCATYANLMLSVWRQGNCHAPPYSPDAHKSGDPKFAQKRYGYFRLNEGQPIRTALAIELEIETHPDELYCLHTNDGGNSVGHMALLHKSRVYECNAGGAGGPSSPPGVDYSGTVQDAGLHDWMLSRGVIACYVSGPCAPRAVPDLMRREALSSSH